MTEDELPPFEPVGTFFGFRGVPATIAIKRGSDVQLDAESAAKQTEQQQGD